MIKKNIPFTDFNGVERTREFLFNLTEEEFVNLQLEKVGGFNAMIDRIINSDDVPAIAEIFKDIILKSHGVKSADGFAFDKECPEAQNFKKSNAFSAMYMGFLARPAEAAEFFKQLVPEGIQEKMKEIAAAQDEAAKINAELIRNREEHKNISIVERQSTVTDSDV